QVARRSGLLHVVAGDRDRVEARHLLARVLDDDGDDPHRGRGRVDVRVPDHELLQDVVLDGPGELRARHALLLTRDDEAREDRQDGAVHRHRHRHLVERYAVEDDLHVLDRIDRDARLPDVADDARVIAVVAAVGGEVEGDREARLPAGEVRAVEGVRLLRGREATVLPDRPRPLRVHRRVRAAEEREGAGDGVREVETFHVGPRPERLHVDALGRPPHEPVRIGPLALLLGELLPEAQVRTSAVVRHGLVRSPIPPVGSIAGGAVTNVPALDRSVTGLSPVLWWHVRCKLSPHYDHRHAYLAEAHTRNDCPPPGGWRRVRGGEPGPLGRLHRAGLRKPPTRSRRVSPGIAEAAPGSWGVLLPLRADGAGRGSPRRPARRLPQDPRRTPPRGKLRDAGSAPRRHPTRGLKRRICVAPADGTRRSVRVTRRARERTAARRRPRSMPRPRSRFAPSAGDAASDAAAPPDWS